VNYERSEVYVDGVQLFWISGPQQYWFLYAERVRRYVLWLSLAYVAVPLLNRRMGMSERSDFRYFEYFID
jgi:hypothetical protein